MSFWTKLFGNAKRDEHSNTDSIGAGDDVDRSKADCGCCGRKDLEADRSARYLYPVWRCPCGALGSGALLPDLDEVGDQLLEVLGITGSVSEPCVPTDHPGITIQRYDANKVQHDMTEMLKSHGYEFRVTPGKIPAERQFWVKRVNET